MTPFAEQLLDLLQDKEPRTPLQIVRELTFLRDKAQVPGIPANVSAAVSEALVELQGYGRIVATEQGWKWAPAKAKPQTMQRGLF